MNEQRKYPDVGDFVTVARWTSHQDSSWCGAVLRVEAVDVPYIAVRQYIRGRPEGMIGGFTLDLRRCEIQRLSPEFVRAAGGPHPNAFAEVMV
jgi:hypothetical protein